MDDRRFDELVRNLAEGTSRRRIVQGLAAVFAGTGLTIGDLTLVGAKKDECKRKDCKKSGREFKCCQEGQGKNKVKVCVNTNNNDDHCGGCGHKCRNGKVCVNGKCKPTS